MKDLADYIDHTLLRADAVLEDIAALCTEAAEYKFASVCVAPSYIKYAAGQLAGSGVKVCTVIGFPLGASGSRVKIYEAMEAVNNGADELDIVINIGDAKAGTWVKIKKELSAIITSTPEALHKIIIETCYLNDDQKQAACTAAINAGAAFVKTSTGFGSSGASVQDVRLMKSVVGDAGVKASGGIKTHSEALAMINAGASRIGTSSGVSIVRQALGVA